MTRGSGSLAEKADEAARAAAERSGVQVRPLHELRDLDSAYALFDGIWHHDKSNPPITRELMRAMTHAGNYAAGAYDGRTLVGASVGFFGAPAGESMHSHITGVAEDVRGRSVGYALKLHQRAWALQRGLTEITWTFDPLVRRNAYFNIVKLGARPQEYLVDFYGDMADSVNVGQGSDRLLIGWPLAAPEVVEACDGRVAEPDSAVLSAAPRALVEVESRYPSPVPAARWRDAARVLVRVPHDVERLRQSDPDAARAWRHALRDVLGDLLTGGARVTGFARAGWYVVEQDTS